MDNIKNIIGGGIIVLIGGSAVLINQEDVVNNFSQDTGFTQEQATTYIENISEQELVSWSEVGDSLIEEGAYSKGLADELECEEYTYDWETAAMTCFVVRDHLYNISAAEVRTGNTYKVLDTEGADASDVQRAIAAIDTLNSLYRSGITMFFFDESSAKESILTNSFNKSVLQASLDAM